VLEVACLEAGRLVAHLGPFEKAFPAEASLEAAYPLGVAPVGAAVLELRPRAAYSARAPAVRHTEPVAVLLLDYPFRYFLFFIV
jgi:hypothetical protein